MVIFTYGVLFGRDSLRMDLLAAVRGTRRAAQAARRVASAKFFGFAQDVMTFRIGDLVKYIVHGPLMRVFGL